MKRRTRCGWILALLVGLAVVDVAQPEGDATALKRKRAGKRKIKAKMKAIGKKARRAAAASAAASATAVTAAATPAPSDDVIDAVIAAPDGTVPITVGAAAVKTTWPAASR